MFFLRDLNEALQLPRSSNLFVLPITVSEAACGFHALIDGPMQTWPLIQRAFELETTGSLER